MTKQKLAVRLGVVAALAVSSLALAVPAAQAATYTYADAKSTPENQARTGGPYATVSGGQAWTLLGLGITAIITYYPAPGYREVGYADGNNPVKVNLSHARESNARSKCYWNFYNVGGTADLTCKAYS